MKQGDYAELTMKKVLCIDSIHDQKIYFCKILRYDVKQECIYLVLENDILTNISLDAIYDCMIQTSEDKTKCSGRVKERYNDEYGQVLKFEIENGFYKINVKSVDK